MRRLIASRKHALAQATTLFALIGVPERVRSRCNISTLSDRGDFPRSPAGPEDFREREIVPVRALRLRRLLVFGEQLAHVRRGASGLSFVERIVPLVDEAAQLGGPGPRLFHVPGRKGADHHATLAAGDGEI
jgi:hypothetical protein